MSASVVVGRITGDGECWCMEVTEGEYRRIKGDKDADFEQECWNEMHEELHMEPPPKIWQIHPDDLIEKAHQGQIVRLEITTKGVSDE